MCLLMVVGFLILLFVTLFVKSAVILLPWTVPATILAALSGMQVGQRLGRTPSARAALGVVATLALACAFGYLAYWLIPPMAPPPKQGWDVLLEPPEPASRDLWQMFPIHLTIWAAVAAKIVGGWCYRLDRQTCVQASDDAAGGE